MTDKIYVELDIDYYHNDDAEQGDGPYLHQGSSTSSLRNVRASLGDFSQEAATYRHATPHNFDAVAGQAVFVVTVHYATGDTFQNSEEVHALAVFNDPDRARAFREFVLEDNRLNPSKFGALEFDGMTFYPSWKGYFEHLNSINIDTVMLGVF